MQNSSNQVRANYSFQITKTGNTHTVTYQKAKYSLAIIFPILLPAVIISFALVMYMRGNLTGMIFMTLALAAGTFFLLNYFRKDGCFSVSDTALILEGKEYPMSHVSKLFIKAPGGYEQTTELTKSTHGFIIGGDRSTRIGMGAASAVTGAVGVVGQAGSLAMQSSRRSIQKQHGKINYSVGFIYGEKEIKLAGGLTENTAEVLLNKVIEMSNPVV